MPYVITELCHGVCDTACVDVCPCDIIHGPLPLDEIRAGARDLQLYIEPDPCIDCAACEPVCPVGAIFYQDDVPAQYAHAIEQNARFFE